MGATTYAGRNRSRIQRNLRKARKAGKPLGTDAVMEAYGNKRKEKVRVYTKTHQVAK